MLRRALGEPTGWGIDKDRDQSQIWRYGDIEFHFSNCLVQMIFSDHNMMVKGTQGLRIAPWIVRRGLDRRDFESALAANAIIFRSKVHPFDECQVVATTESGAEFSFIEESDGYSLGWIAGPLRHYGTINHRIAKLLDEFRNSSRRGTYDA